MIKKKIKPWKKQNPSGPTAEEIAKTSRTAKFIKGFVEKRDQILATEKATAKAKLQSEIARLKRELQDSPSQPELNFWLVEAEIKLAKL